MFFLLLLLLWLRAGWRLGRRRPLLHHLLRPGRWALLPLLGHLLLPLLHLLSHLLLALLLLLLLLSHLLLALLLLL